MAHDNASITHEAAHSHLANEHAHTLISRVYEELHRLAEQRLRTVGNGASLRPTELLHEVFVKLGYDPNKTWNGHTHFIAAAAVAMRSILIDRARRAHAAKRGGGQQRVSLELAELAIDRSADEILAVDEALNQLEKTDERSAKVVRMRFYLGLDFAEIALSLGVTERTVERDWAFARRWLAQELRKPGTA
ncbi:MAG TPA: ECF-type sigma factor [Phycisphaerales bacterium]|nr:ECF-type sigma factor [Phycisphaerales bacterium]